MKKYLAVVALSFFISGCVSVGVTPQMKSQEVIVKVVTEEGKAIDTAKPDIQKVMHVLNPEPALPNDAIIVGDICYYTLWSAIGVVDALNFWKTLKILDHRKIKHVRIYINSPGGSAFDGIAFADAIVAGINEGFVIETEASGIIASAAVPIFSVGQKRIASAGTIFMVHEGKIGKYLAWEGKDDLRSQQEMFEITDARYNNILVTHSNLSLQDVKAMCKKTTWFTAEQAKKWELVDEIK